MKIYLENWKGEISYEEETFVRDHKDARYIKLADELKTGEAIILPEDATNKDELINQYRNSFKLNKGA